MSLRSLPLAIAASWVLAALAMSGCADIDTLDERYCPDAGTTHTYPSFGQPFFGQWCNSCHSASPGNRQGAPEDVRFDDVGQIRDWADRIYARAAAGNDSMPPGNDDPPRAVREQLAEWLACGAPD